MTVARASLTDRFIDIDGWPTARKTVLVMGLATISHLADWAFLHVLLRGNRSFDIGVIDGLMASGAVAFLVCLLAGAAAVATGKSGGWTAYLFVVLGGGFFVAMPYVFGFWTSALYATIPVTILLTALWYGRNVAIALFVFYSVVSATVGVMQSRGILAYAPGLSDPTADLSGSTAWIVATMVPVQLVFGVVFVLSFLVIGARQLQEIRIHDAQKQLQHSHWLIRRYVPPAVADRLEVGDTTVDLAQRRRVTVFSSDVVGFTVMADRLDPEALAEVINDYIAALADLLDRHHGTVTEFAGDGMMALFGAPDDRDPEAQVRSAVAAAHELHASLPQWSKRWYRLGITEPLQARVGINTGVVSVGTFGSSVRATYTGIGIQMNIAARIQAEATPGNTLISNTSWHLINDTIDCRAHGDVLVKGVHYPIGMYEPVHL